MMMMNMNEWEMEENCKWVGHEGFVETLCKHTGRTPCSLFSSSLLFFEVPYRFNTDELVIPALCAYEWCEPYQYLV